MRILWRNEYKEYKDLCLFAPDTTDMLDCGKGAAVYVLTEMGTPSSDWIGSGGPSAPEEVARMLGADWVEDFRPPVIVDPDEEPDLLAAAHDMFERVWDGKRPRKADRELTAELRRRRDLALATRGVPTE